MGTSLRRFCIRVNLSSKNIDKELAKEPENQDDEDSDHFEDHDSDNEPPTSAKLNRLERGIQKPGTTSFAPLRIQNNCLD